MMYEINKLVLWEDFRQKETMNFCVNHKHTKQGYKFWKVKFFYNNCRLFNKNVRK